MEHPISLRSILILSSLRLGQLNGLLSSGLSTEMHFTSPPFTSHSSCFSTRFGALHCADFFGLQLLYPSFKSQYSQRFQAPPVIIPLLGRKIMFRAHAEY